MHYWKVTFGYGNLPLPYLPKRDFAIQNECCYNVITAPFSLGWNIRGHVFGDFADFDQSAIGFLDFNYRVRSGVLHSFIEFGQIKCEFLIFFV